MKQISTLIILSLFMLSVNLSAQVAITTDGSSADPSAMLEVKSTDKGILFPRLTLTQIEAVANPAAGLIVFNSDDKRFYFYDDGAAEWKELAIGGGIILPGGTSFSCGDNITFIYNGSEVTYGTVSGQNGTCWLDRNLGASRVAISSNDSDAYGDLFQWGRLDDGHQLRNSSITWTLSNSDIPGHGNFINNLSGPPYDWRNPQNDDLWQGLNGTNNPCPNGFRIPTETELNVERLSWSSNNIAGAFESPLKLTIGGGRDSEDGIFGQWSGYYWTADRTGAYSRYLLLLENSAEFWGQQGSGGLRSNGYSVRCIMD